MLNQLMCQSIGIRALTSRRMLTVNGNRQLCIKLNDLQWKNAKEMTITLNRSGDYKIFRWFNIKSL